MGAQHLARPDGLGAHILQCYLALLYLRVVQDCPAHMATLRCLPNPTQIRAIQLQHVQLESKHCSLQMRCCVHVNILSAAVDERAVTVVSLCIEIYGD